MSTLTGKKRELKPVWPSIGEYGFVPIDSIVPSPHNPRKFIDREGILSLSNGMRKGGQREIITVRELTEKEIAKKYPHARYMLVSGERRWHSAKEALLPRVEVRVRGYEDAAAEALDAYMLNGDREAISDLEEAWAIQHLAELHGWKTQEEIAFNTNHDPMWVSQTLALLKLSPVVQERMHPRLKPKERLRKQVGVFLSRLSHDMQDDFVSRMPESLATAAAQLAWLRKELDATDVEVPTRRRDPFSVRRMLEAFARTMQQKAEELLSAQELARLFENTEDPKARAFANRLKRAHADFGQLVSKVEELSHGEKRNTMLFAREHIPSAKSQPKDMCRFQRDRKERRLTSVLWFNAVSERYLPDEVTHEQYAALFDRGLLKFQREGAPKPFHYPDREKIVVKD